MKYVHVLVDYDNVRPKPEKRHSDVVSNLSSLIPDLEQAIYKLIPDSEEIWLRLYGGWIETDGRNSQQHGWLLSEISRFRGRRGSLRVKISIATTLICRSDLALIGTYRNKGQKMVDVMLAIDLICLSEEQENSLVIVSDDEDFVPGIVAGSCRRMKRGPIYVLRRERAAGLAENDHLLAQCNARVVNF